MAEARRRPAVSLESLPLRRELHSESTARDLKQAIEAISEMEPLPLLPGEDLPLEKEARTLGSGAPKLIGISGRPRAGKDTIADSVLARYRNVRRINFSDLIIDEINDWLAGTGHKLTEGNKSDPAYRLLMQAWGMARREEDPNYWTDSIKRTIENYWDSGTDLVLVCGVRALSDLEAIEELGGEHWRVVRPANAYQAEHEIEKQLDELPPERQTVFINDSEGNPGALHEKVYQTLEGTR